MNTLETSSIAASYVELRPNRDGAMRAFVVGTRIRVQDIASDYERHGLTPEAIVREFPQLSLAQVHSALAFYYDHCEEIRADMKSDDEYARQTQANAGRNSDPGLNKP